MNKELKKAFNKTIERWEKIVDDVTYYDLPESNCALCDYKRNIIGTGFNCKGCPIREKTGQFQCGGTPWRAFMDNRTAENALRELVFLKDLYIELMECPIPCPKPPSAFDDMSDEQKSELVELWVKKIEMYEKMEKRAKEEWCSEAKHTKPQVEWIDITKDLKCRIARLGNFYFPTFYYNDKHVLMWAGCKWELYEDEENYKIEFDTKEQRNFRVLKREK